MNKHTNHDKYKYIQISTNMHSVGLLIYLIDFEIWEFWENKPVFLQGYLHLPAITVEIIIITMSVCRNEINCFANKVNYIK